LVGAFCFGAGVCTLHPTSNLLEVK
jgi:hypothetical protein